MSVPSDVSHESGRPLEMRLKDGVAEMTLPGFSEWEISENGLIKLWNVSSVFEAGRSIAMRALNLGNMRTHLGEGKSLFVRYIHYSLSRQINSVGEPPYTSKLKLLVTLLSCGNTSFILKETMHRYDDMVELASATLRYVYVDMKTRKSATVPDDMRAFCQSELGNGSVTPQPKYNLPTQPDYCFQCVFEVEPHHIDQNQHTNQSRYVQFCCDAAADAVSKGGVKGQTLSTWVPRVTDMLTVYDGESREGDELVVYIWQEHSPSNNILFSITLRERVIFKCQWTLAEEVCILMSKARL